MCTPLCLCVSGVLWPLCKPAHGDSRFGFGTSSGPQLFGPVCVVLHLRGLCPQQGNAATLKALLTSLQEISIPICTNVRSPSLSLFLSYPPLCHSLFLILFCPSLSFSPPPLSFSHPASLSAPPLCFSPPLSVSLSFSSPSILSQFHQVLYEARNAAHQAKFGEGIPD